MTGARIAVPLGLAVAMAIAGLTIAPRGFDAEELLLAQDDPVALADRAIARSFDATVAAREINAALAANDPDLAQSFLELARDRNVPVDSALAQKVELANAGAASAARSIESFARGLVTGEPEDLAGLAGTAVGDLFVFGDIRDAVREGTRLASGQEADQLILGLAWRRPGGDGGNLCQRRRGRAGAGRAHGGEGGAQDRADRQQHGGLDLRARCARWSIGRRCSAPPGAHASPSPRSPCAPPARRSRSTRRKVWCGWSATSGACRRGPERRPRSMD